MNAASIRAAIVTGGSRGIGAAIAEQLAADGFAVTVNYAANTAEAQAVVEKIAKAGARAIAVQADVSEVAAMRALFDRTEATVGGVDVLVNNAGVMQLKSIADTDEALFDRQVAINLKGVFNGMREAAKRLRSGGRVISLSSSVVGQYQPTYGAYAATKGAVEALTHVLANEMRGRNITVNAIAPGPTTTDLFLTGETPELVERISKLAPLERLGTPVEIAAAVAFLAGPDGSWVNGQVLRVNGGLV
jgi:3-oxoacyl-[acyl-carrier protein] reductase